MRGWGTKGERGRGEGDLRVVISPHLLLSPHWAGLFLMPMDTPHWLRVSVASPWNSGKL